MVFIAPKIITANLRQVSYVQGSLLRSRQSPTIHFSSILPYIHIIALLCRDSRTVCPIIDSAVSQLKFFLSSIYILYLLAIIALSTCPEIYNRYIRRAYHAIIHSVCSRFRIIYFMLKYLVKSVSEKSKATLYTPYFLISPCGKKLTYFFLNKFLYICTHVYMYNASAGVNVYCVTYHYPDGIKSRSDIKMSPK